MVADLANLPVKMVKAKLFVEPEILSDILQVAFMIPGKGACYWATVDEVSQIEGPDHGPAQGDDNDVWYSVTIRNTVIDDKKRMGKRYKIDHHIVAEGIAVILQSRTANCYWQVLKAVVNSDIGQIDPEIADTIIQNGIWREVLYR